MTIVTTQHLRTPLLSIESVGCQGEHTHAEECSHQSELVFIRRGSFTRYDHHGHIIADANHALFFDRDHLYEIDHPIAGGDACTVFHLRDDILRDLFRHHTPSAADQPDLRFPRGMLPVTAAQQIAHHQLLHAAQSDADPLALEEAVITLFDSILCAAFDTSTSDSPLSADHSALASEVMLHLSRTYTHKQSLHDIAAAVHSSPYHLARLFKAHTGRSIHQYRIDLRLHHALDLLAATEQPITDLALNLGFHSHSHFSNAFRQTFGLAPSTFRHTATTRTLAQSRRILQV